MPDEDDQSRHWLGHSDKGMSPIVIVVMVGVRVTLFFLAGLLVLITAIFTWEKLAIDVNPMAKADWGMLGLLCALLVFTIVLAIKIGTELKSGRG